jgi:hypothetical protein
MLQVLWGAVMEALKGTGAVVVALAAAAGLVLGLIWLIRTGVDVALWVLPWLQVFNEIAFAFCLLLLLPLAIFRKTRAISAIGFQIASYSFGASLWFYGLLVTYVFWGVMGVFVGLVLLGVGVVPVAAVAAIIHAEWDALGQIALGVFLTFGSRFLCVYLLTKSEPRIGPASPRVAT